MKNFYLTPLFLFAAALLPISLFFWSASSTFKSHIHQAVVNDPQAGLSQSLNTLKGAVAQWQDKTAEGAVRLSENENFKKYFLTPVPSLAAFRVFGKKLSESTQLPLILIVDKKGDIVYDTLNIPRPTPSPTVEGVKKAAKSRSTGPLLASAKDFPGMDKALSGTTQSGFFIFQNKLYNGTLLPVSEKGKNIGVVILAALLDDDWVHSLRSNIGGDLIVYSRGQTWSSSPLPAPGLDYDKIEASNGAPLTLDRDHASYLIGGLALNDFESKPLAFIALFQPVKKNFTVEGSPEKTIARQGRWFLLLGLLLAGVGTWLFLSPFHRLTQAIGQIKSGGSNITLPLQRPDEWGILARSLQAMIDGLKERDRVSLILGKVASPLTAKKILEANDLFALKGERREVTLLQADLRGFNALSENMAPQNLVEALNQYFTLINEIVFKHEGTLDRFIGGTAIALWGAPLLQDDKEMRAVEAALEIQESLKDFNIARIKKGLPPFTIAIGLHTGLVVSGNLGSDKHSDYTVIGDPLQIAARLCAMAGPGQTVVSEETFLKITSLVRSKALNPIAVKGSMEQLKTYEITEI